MKTYSRINKLQDLNILPQEYINSCRLCLNNVSNSTSIDLLAFDQKLTKNKIKFCTGLEIVNGDGLPSKLCNNCYKTVTTFFTFKQMCIVNELKLQKFSRIPKNILPEINFHDEEEERTKDLELISDTSVNKDVISLIEENCNAVSFLLEEENIHPDAPNDVILQIKKECTESVPAKQKIPEESLEESFTVNTTQRRPELPYRPVLRSKETQPRSYACRECKECFTRTYMLISHEQQVHNIQRLYCSHCSQSFISKSLIERHMRTHTSDKPFRCVICSKTFSQKESLNRHYARLHSEKKYECEKCPKMFTSREGLKSHFFTHHTVRTNEELYRYKCKYCTKSFCHSSGLSRHLLTHTGVLFTCKICQKGFSDGSCLRRHSLIAHQERNHRFVENLLQKPHTIKNSRTTSPNGKNNRPEQNLLPCG